MAERKQASIRKGIFPLAASAAAAPERERERELDLLGEKKGLSTIGRHFCLPFDDNAAASVENLPVNPQVGQKVTLDDLQDSAI